MDPRDSHQGKGSSPGTASETLCEADSPPDSWRAGTGGSWWLNDTGDSVALLLTELVLGSEGSQDWWPGTQAVELASLL